MYELTFSVENTNEGLLKYLYQELSCCVDKVGGICKYLHDKRRSKFALACNDLYSATIKEQAEDYLVDVLTLGFKNVYVRKRLKIEEGNLYLNTLVNTMCIFDNKFDKQFIKNQVDINGEVCIDGYYNFRMKRLKSKWDELISVVQNNQVFLNDCFLIKEFLCYLLDFFSQSQKNISIVINDGKFSLFDDKGKLMQPIKLVYPSTLEELIIINSICIKPKCINLYCDSSALQSGFLDLLSYLFDVKLIENS